MVLGILCKIIGVSFQRRNMTCQ